MWRDIEYCCYGAYYHNPPKGIYLLTRYQPTEEVVMQPVGIEEVAPQVDLPGTPTSSIRCHPIWTYLRSAKLLGWLLVVSLFWSARLSSVIGNYELKLIANSINSAELFWDLLFFTLASISQTFFFFAFITSLYKFCVIPAASKLHNSLVSNVLTQPMEYFETVAIGDILNLFTNDISRVDNSLNASLISIFAQYTNLSISCAVLIMTVPSSTFFIAPLVALCILIQHYYFKRLRELRHFDATSRAPLLNYLQEAAKGGVLFKIYDATTTRLRSFHILLENNLRVLLPLSCLELWLALRLELLCVTLQALAVGVLLAAKVDASALGFTMTYLFQVTAILSTIARMGALFEADCVSLSRIYECSGGEKEKEQRYSRNRSHGSDLEQQGFLVEENDCEVHGALLQTPPAWPTHGKIEFRSVSARYRSILPISLDSIDITIRSGEKIAVIGRTGAGKSSLVLSLLKLMELTAGEILIDGLNISMVHDTALRRAIAIIPQHPVLFPGTVRQNLDPMSLYTDSEILKALEKSTAIRTIQNLAARSEKHISALNILLDLRLDAG
jgi:ATP-binding cassette, subfamily C (CFTR/MRP), member 1